MLLNYLIILYLLSPAIIVGVAVLEWAGSPLGAGALGQKGLHERRGNVTSGQGCCQAVLSEGSSGLLRLNKRCETWEASELVQSPLAQGLILCCALPFAFKLNTSWIGFGSSLWSSEFSGWCTLNY